MQVRAVGALLGVPMNYFHDRGSVAMPSLWGYVGRIIRLAPVSDQTAFDVQCFDGAMEFYLDPHPKFTVSELHRYLTSPEIKVICLGPPAGLEADA